MSVLTATGEHLIVPLAKVEIESGQGKHVELVGVLDKLPVDCLLGRSSFGQTLTKENVLKQWELARARTAPSPTIPIIFSFFPFYFCVPTPKIDFFGGEGVTKIHLAEHFKEKVLQKYFESDELHLVFDRYDVPFSLKSATRVRRQGDQQPG